MAESYAPSQWSWCNRFGTASVSVRLIIDANGLVCVSVGERKRECVRECLCVRESVCTCGAKAFYVTNYQ